jgi:hypothetical protein
MLIENQQMHQNCHFIVTSGQRCYMFRLTNAIIRELIWSSHAAAYSFTILTGANLLETPLFFL